MPVYEYVCDGCGRTTELMRPMAQVDVPVRCEHCGSDRTHRSLSVFMAGADKAARTTGSLPINACGRCGDPRGSCG